MRITRYSGWIYIHLFEIESPRKRLFTASGQQTATYTQALSQLGDWRGWFDDRENALAFRRYYSIPQAWSDRRTKVTMALVYGRRSEVRGNVRGSRLRSAMTPGGVEVMSFDRLRPQEAARDDLTVRVSRSGVRAVQVQPTLVLSPQLADSVRHVSGKAAAILRNAYLGDDRKRWLTERFAAFDAQFRSHEGPIFLSGEESD